MATGDRTFAVSGRLPLLAVRLGLATVLLELSPLLFIVQLCITAETNLSEVKRAK